QTYRSNKFSRTYLLISDYIEDKRPPILYRYYRRKELTKRKIKIKRKGKRRPARKQSEGGNAMEKVTVPKEVAEAIENARRRGASDFVILNRAVNGVVTVSNEIIRKWAFGQDGGSP